MGLVSRSVLSAVTFRLHIIEGSWVSRVLQLRIICFHFHPYLIIIIFHCCCSSQLFIFVTIIMIIVTPVNVIIVLRRKPWLIWNRRALEGQISLFLHMKERLNIIAHNTNSFILFLQQNTSGIACEQFLLEARIGCKKGDFNTSFYVAVFWKIWKLVKQCITNPCILHCASFVVVSHAIILDESFLISLSPSSVTLCSSLLCKIFQAVRSTVWTWI